MNEQLDQDAVNLAKAIRKVESNDTPTARGASGEFGYYQFMPQTWASSTKKFLGRDVPTDQATPELQNEVAYKQIKEWKDKGYNPGQIASMWNAGPGKPDAYLEGNKGTNKYGVAYDTAEYARKVAETYQQVKSGAGYAPPGATPTAQGGIGYPAPVPPQRPEIPMPSQTVSQEKADGNWAQKIGAGLIQSEKNFGESIAGAILPFTGTGKKFESDQANQMDQKQKLGQIIIKRLREKNARGEDTSREREQLTNMGMAESLSMADFNPASQKNAKQVIGEAIGVGADILSAGVYGKAATGLKTGVMGKAIGPTLTAPLTRSQGIIRGGVQGALTGAGAGAVQGGARAMQEDKDLDRKSTRLNSSHIQKSRMPSSA